MLRAIKSILFGCQHEQLTWPQSPRRVGPVHPFDRHARPNVTCINCGSEFEYDLNHMRVGRRVFPPHHQHPDIAPTLERES